MKTSEQELTAAVKAYALLEGADLVGIAPVSRYEGAPAKLRPQAHFPEAQAVIVMAIHHPDASIDFGAEPNSNYPGAFQIGMIPKLDTLAFRMAKFLEHKGHPTVPYSCTYYWHHRKQDGVDFDHAATFSHMNAFVAAGLGEYGWHGMVMSPQYGPRQRIVSVFTSAPLVADPLYDGEPLCDRCKLCEKACWGENYKTDALLSPATVSFEIEGKRFEYANINRWRCFWGEQCHLDMRELARRDKLDEQGIYKAIDSGVERIVAGSAGYMCSSFKFCMSKPVRRWDKKKAPGPLRKKAAPTASWPELKQGILARAAAAGADRVAVIPLKSFAEAISPNFLEGFRVDDFFKSFKWVVCIGHSLPQFAVGEENPLVAKNLPPYRQLTSGRLMIGSIDLARYLDDEGYEAWQDAAGISKVAFDLTGWSKNGVILSLATDAPLEKFEHIFPDKFRAQENLSALLDVDNGQHPQLDLAGSVRLEDLPQARREELQALMPTAKSLIVVGAELPLRTVELAGRQEAACGVSYQQVNYQAMRESFWAAQDIASSLLARGHEAAPLFDVDADSKGRVNNNVSFLPDLRAQAPYAAAAGLGFLGKSGFLISPRFGPRQRFAFVLTSAELPAPPAVTGACPEGCRACAEACPVQALNADRAQPQAAREGEKGNPVFARCDARCEWARVMGMVEGEGSALGGWRLPKLPVPDALDDAARDQALALKDPIQVRCYNRPNHADMQIERCLQACPFGKKHNCL
jgi:epoxyqueuosine reductase QueG